MTQQNPQIGCSLDDLLREEGVPKEARCAVSGEAVWRRFLFVVLLLGVTASAQKEAAWPTYGGDPGGQRYSTAAQITPGNVKQLKPAWTFHTGSLARKRLGTSRSSFEATPILFGGTLYFTTPFDDVFALDPATGTERWHHDSGYPGTEHGVLTSRGVAAWPQGAASAQGSVACAARIFVATMDARLLALDAANGAACNSFGTGGVVDLKDGMGVHDGEEYFFSSPPTVIGDIVVVGSGIGDNQRVDSASGAVRGFDARTGKLVWAWDPIPWAQKQALHTGSANAWSVISADPEHNLVFVPTGSPSPDFYGGKRPGENRDANSVVALEATTGRRVWGFQVVHHDLWDYDVASEPVLFLWRKSVPAVAVTTKMGMVFVLNRLTGEPLFPVEERPVPRSDVPGEVSSPTQPFQQIDSLSPLTLAADAPLSDSPENNAACRALLSRMRYEGIYTPPSMQGTVDYPGNLGGVNWGGAAVDASTGVLYANANSDIFSLKVVPRTPHDLQNFLWGLQKNYLFFSSLVATLVAVLLLVGMLVLRRTTGKNILRCLAAGAVAGLLFGMFLFIDFYGANPNVEHFGREFSEQRGTPYENLHDQVTAPGNGHLCSPMPWGRVSALDLNTGKLVWQTPLGTAKQGQRTGTMSLGGDIVTSAGLVFTGASREPLLRAFDAHSGAELWDGALPAPAQSTPMTYTVHGRQYVVIAAGGHGLFQTPLSDSLVAYALPQ